MERNDVVEITPLELAERMRGGSAPDVIDVREPREWQFAHIEGTRLVPLGELAGCMTEMDPASEIVVMCRSGVRSANAVRQLQAAGFTNVRNLAGGILRWSDDVDPGIPKY